MKKIIFLLLVLLPFLSNAEDGSKLWLRAETGSNATVTTTPNRQTPTINIAKQELESQWKGARVQLNIVNNAELQRLGKDGYLITGNKLTGITIQASAEQGLLYGAYHLLRLQETGKDIGALNIAESPKYDLRILNHWENLGWAFESASVGRSFWRSEEMPQISSRLNVYARANASVGLNGAVLNNPNASPDMLTRESLQKVKVIADELRPYNVKVYLSVNFASPKELGGLPTADPLDKDVIEWWKGRAKEIYSLIPDFGGFLVKADSESLPGPHDYGRTHADGANVLAEALKPYNGVVMWRAFVYNPSEPGTYSEYGGSQDYSLTYKTSEKDRANQAYSEFMPLDGKFMDNVILQVKNGPIDFQPREPFSPLFGAMKETALMPELQIMQEYLGNRIHSVFLATQWKEFFESDTYCAGKGSTVAKTTDKTIYPHKVSAIAAVANIGNDVNWTGNHLSQANWYAFGRLAWNHELSADQIADEWLQMTFSQNPAFVNPAKEIMLDTWETTVSFSQPLGLHHIFAWRTHYGPEPWCDIPGVRPDWLPVNYHLANDIGVGYDRSVTGSNGVNQYFSPLREELNNIKTCPEKFLLWFHHVPWDFHMKSGRIFWDELCYTYQQGVDQMRDIQKRWDRLENFIDSERFLDTQYRLKIQSRDALWWRDACILYFQTFSQRPIPYELERPVYDLEELKQIKLLDINNILNGSRQL